MNQLSIMPKYTNCSCGADMKHMTPRFEVYKEKILSLPAEPAPSDITREDFLLGREGRLEVFYAPLHGVTSTARIVIVGLTPGRAQMVAAFRDARRLFLEGWRPPRLFHEVRRRIAFKDSMRTNLVGMLDRIGVADRLGLATSAELFEDAANQLHSTSALRYPVLIDGENHHGSPGIRNSWLLAGMIHTNLRAELSQLPDALIVPLGKAVEDALVYRLQ